VPAPWRGAGVQRGGRAQVWTAMHTDEGDGSVSFLLHELLDGPNHEVHAAAPAVPLSPAPALSPRAPQSVFEPRMGEFCARSMQVEAATPDPPGVCADILAMT
jgi:hypothetical protein